MTTEVSILLIYDCHFVVFCSYVWFSFIKQLTGYQSGHMKLGHLVLLQHEL